MQRRNTIQKELILKAVKDMRSHVTADEVCEFIRKDYPNIGKGTVYRNLSVLSEEKKIRRVEIPGGPDRFDFTLARHYHILCVKCGRIFDVDMDEIKDIGSRIKDRHGMEILDYDILFKGICEDCATKEKEEKEKTDGQKSYVQA